MSRTPAEILRLADGLEASHIIADDIAINILVHQLADEIRRQQGIIREALAVLPPPGNLYSVEQLNAILRRALSDDSGVDRG